MGKQESAMAINTGVRIVSVEPSLEALIHPQALIDAEKVVNSTTNTQRRIGSSAMGWLADKYATYDGLATIDTPEDTSPEDYAVDIGQALAAKYLFREYIMIDSARATSSQLTIAEATWAVEDAKVPVIAFEPDIDAVSIKQLERRERLFQALSLADTPAAYIFGAPVELAEDGALENLDFIQDELVSLAVAV